jgi:hypothetical protein
MSEYLLRKNNRIHRISCPMKSRIATTFGTVNGNIAEMFRKIKCLVEMARHVACTEQMRSAYTI